mmetsp:Transcript_7354/g.5620  ORF Transcript_7354/g.5620 Transcript_7354/m.5620 type:complete len:118 (+) Transcript_7354:130-483(+)
MEYEIPKPEEGQSPCYMVLESIVPSNASNKTLHVINFSKIDRIKVGRSNDSDVRINDISVSRFHSQIQKTSKGHFYVQDHNSKFGTLIQVKYPMLLSPIEPTFLQAGRSLLEISLRK